MKTNTKLHVKINRNMKINVKTSINTKRNMNMNVAVYMGKEYGLMTRR
jgi:hypothetical protein